MRGCKFGSFILVTVLFTLVVENYGWTDTTYRAAVVEFMPVVAHKHNVTRDQALEIMHQNIDSYEKFVARAKNQGVDIIVFPEFGLYGPNFATRDAVYPYLESIPNGGANPCTELEFYPYLNITHRLSCMAMKYEITMAVDMGDVQFCSKWDSDCPKDRRYQFNTVVVFGADGAIISKYHKTNLYFEPEFDVPMSQHPAAFDLFGVRFGMIICFDIMFAKPQVEMLKRFGVTDLIFSSWWVNTPPILTATQIQQGWSRAFGLNMLASNSGLNLRTSGSGIFSKGVALESFTNPTRTSRNRLLIADVPKLAPIREDPETPQLENAKRIPDYVMYQPKPLTLHAKVLRTWDVDSSMSFDQVSVDGLTCAFTYQMAPRQSTDSKSSKPRPATVVKPVDSLNDENASERSTQLPLDNMEAQYAPEPTNMSLILYAANGYLTPLFPALACGIATCPTDDANVCITLLQRPHQTMSIGPNHANFSFFSLKAQFQDVRNLTVYPVSAKDEGALFTEQELTYKKHPNPALHQFTTPISLHETKRSTSLLHVGFLARNLEVSL